MGSAVARPRMRMIRAVLFDLFETLVTESVELRTPAVLRRFALGQATSVQQSRATELTRRMERRS